jgi:hypothetical protein
MVWSRDPVACVKHTNILHPVNTQRYELFVLQHLVLELTEDSSSSYCSTVLMTSFTIKLS